MARILNMVCGALLGAGSLVFAYNLGFNVGRVNGNLARPDDVPNFTLDSPYYRAEFHIPDGLKPELMENLIKSRMYEIDAVMGLKDQNFERALLFYQDYLKNLGHCIKEEEKREENRRL